MKRSIRLRGMNGSFKGRHWENGELLRVGRLEALEVVLEDSSVSRYHAEVRLTDRGWRVRDLGSTNGTRLNGVRLGNGQWPLRERDMLQFGEIALVVEHIVEEETVAAQTPTAPDYQQKTTPLEMEGRSVRSKDVGSDMRVTGELKASFHDALESLAMDFAGVPRGGDKLKVLLRAGHHLMHIEKEDELLQNILNDAVAALSAQRGAIVLTEAPDDRLKIKAITTGRSDARAMLASGRGEGRFQFSQSLAARCISRGESILCQKAEEDPDLANARSIAEGTMASVLCVLLRTPRKILGILHLDRGPFQDQFTMEDLKLADGLAANVSAGIECAQLLRKQRDLFLDTITILAQAVELRDEYTGNHTYRVTTYSIMLAEHLDIAADQLELLRIGTPLHDIGKIGIDDAILRKPDRLTAEEFAAMKEHTVKGAEIISTIHDLRPILPIVRNHHERWDGKGYPDGLAGHAISPLARVVALADAFDAMTSDRPYRKGMSTEVAFAEIEKQAGKQFDPDYAVAFLEIRKQIEEWMAVNASMAATAKRTRVVGQTAPAAT